MHNPTALDHYRLLECSGLLMRRPILPQVMLGGTNIERADSTLGAES